MSAPWLADVYQADGVEHGLLRARQLAQMVQAGAIFSPHLGRWAGCAVNLQVSAALRTHPSSSSLDPPEWNDRAVPPPNP